MTNTEKILQGINAAMRDPRQLNRVERIRATWLVALGSITLILLMLGIGQVLYILGYNLLGDLNPYSVWILGKI